MHTVLPKTQNGPGEREKCTFSSILFVCSVESDVSFLKWSFIGVGMVSDGRQITKCVPRKCCYSLL